MSNIHSAFVRQRRSLILISFILSAVLVFGITGTEIRAAPGGGSVSLNVGKTQYIVYALWVAWGWFLYRYWQLFLVARLDDLESLRNDQRPKIERAFLKPLLGLGEGALKRQLENEYQKAEDFRIVGVVLSTAARRERWKRVHGVAQAESVAVVKNGRATGIGRQRAPVELRRPWIWPRLCAPVFLVNLKHRYFTEYWSAFVVALLPIALAFAR